MDVDVEERLEFILGNFKSRQREDVCKKIGTIMSTKVFDKKISDELISSFAISLAKETGDTILTKQVGDYFVNQINDPVKRKKFLDEFIRPYQLFQTKSPDVEKLHNHVVKQIEKMKNENETDDQLTFLLLASAFYLTYHFLVAPSSSFVAGQLTPIVGDNRFERLKAIRNCIAHPEKRMTKIANGKFKMDLTDVPPGQKPKPQKWEEFSIETFAEEYNSLNKTYYIILNWINYIEVGQFLWAYTQGTKSIPLPPEMNEVP